MKPVMDPASPKTFAEEAKISPTTVFNNPKEVVHTESLTQKEKSDVLTQWEADAISLQTATDEGMSGGQRPRLDEVKGAQTSLAKQTQKWFNKITSRISENAAPSTLTGDEARQGETGHNVRYVLVFGLIGIISAFILLGFYFSTV